GAPVAGASVEPTAAAAPAAGAPAVPVPGAAGRAGPRLAPGASSPQATRSPSSRSDARSARRGNARIAGRPPRAPGAVASRESRMRTLTLRPCPRAVNEARRNGARGRPGVQLATTGHGRSRRYQGLSAPLLSVTITEKKKMFPAETAGDAIDVPVPAMFPTSRFVGPISARFMGVARRP